jgi:DNA ligase (NAD+)
MEDHNNQPQDQPQDLLRDFALWQKAATAYYNDESIMSDHEFDELEQRLLKSGNEYITEFIRTHISSTSPTTPFLKIDDSLEDGQQVSLKKVKYHSKDDAKDIVKFFHDTPASSTPSTQTIYYISPKFDGCSIRIVNTAPNITITTRGGQDVTEKLINNPTIQFYLTNPIFHRYRYICGELLIKKSTFNSKYSDDFENPRNFVAGQLNRIVNKSADQEIINDLDFVAYTDGTNPLIYDADTAPETPVWKPLILPHQITSLDIYNFDLERYYEFLKSDDFPYLCDGVVIAYQVRKRQIKDNYPLNMLAVKFKSETVTTVVTGFVWTQKKSNKLTPVILVNPVRLDGSTISKCSGYNYEYLKNNGIGIGSLIEITKSGDIIPVVVRTIRKSSEITMPDIPHTISGKHLIIADENDASKISKFYNAFSHLQTKGIGKGIGKESSIQIGNICNYDIIEMFNPDLKMNFAMGLDTSSALYKNFTSIYQITSLFLSDVIYMLQFENVGITLSNRFEDILIKRSTDVSGISKEVIDNVLRFEGFQKIKDATQKLKEYGIKVIPKPQVSDTTITFEMTGNPPNMTKEQFVDAITKKYDCTHTSLTKNTTYLITDDMYSNSSKMTKARKYNIKIITYQNALQNGFV